MTQLVGTRDPNGALDVTELVEPFRLAAIWQDPDGRVRGVMTVNCPRESLRLRSALARGGAA